MHRRWSLTFPALVMALACLTQASAKTRVVLVVNAGNAPIFSLRIGHAAQKAWSGDLLAFNQAIDVSSGVELPINFDPVTCAYDVQATYEDGHVAVKRDIDLCSVRRLNFGQ
ncbi:MAG: hypothetical protein ACYDGM_11630 [Vulcanimicrobiaceae bacterium]